MQVHDDVAVDTMQFPSLDVDFGTDQEVDSHSVVAAAGISSGTIPEAAAGRHTLQVGALLDVALHQ